jgi:hypothetical protein
VDRGFPFVATAREPGRYMPMNYMKTHELHEDGNGAEMALDEYWSDREVPLHDFGNRHWGLSGT